MRRCTEYKDKQIKQVHESNNWRWRRIRRTNKKINEINLRNVLAATEKVHKRKMTIQKCDLT